MTRIIKKYGGGGGSTTKTIPDWMPPYLETGLSASQSALTGGDLSQVAGFNTTENAAQTNAVIQAGQQDAQTGATLAQANQVLSTAGSTGLGVDPSVLANNPQLKAVQDATIRSAQIGIGGQQAVNAKQGAIGGGRQALQTSENEANLSAALAQQNLDQLNKQSATAIGAAQTGLQALPSELSAITAGSNTLQSVGTAQQKQTQAELDSQYQGLSRFSSLIQGTPWQSQQQTSGGK